MVIVGQGFANSLTQYGDFGSGARLAARPRAVQPDRRSFEVKFETGDVQRGAARVFRADVEVVDRPGAAPRREVLEVNRPIKIGGSTVH